MLKDASSTAIYGSLGANGTIIITTKRGKAGKPHVSYNGYIGVNGWPQYPDMLTGEGCLNARRESYRTAGQWSSTADDAKIFTPNEWDAIQNGQWTDWADEVFHNGIVQNHQITASGGTDRTTALFPAGFYQEEGSFKDDKSGGHVIDPTNDRTYIGSTSPKWTAGLNNNFRYKILI